MTTILVSGWNVGFDKVGFTLLLKKKAGYSLYDGKQATNRVMQGEPVEVVVPEAEAQSLQVAMIDLGVRCSVAVSLGA